ILIEYGADPTTPCFNPAAPIENACRANLSEEILSQYKEIAEFYDIEYDEEMQYRVGIVPNRHGMEGTQEIAFICIKNCS
ncbi:MAG: hypothetical protein VXY27_02095, partial [Thermoproteota archaeon]|nr:hypothetical protein [Thermoproteota archaeon]